MIKAKRIYDPPSRGDGYRLLTMRLWPRGVRKDAVDRWEKELGPSVELLRAYRGGGIDWREYRRRYRAEMREKPELLDDVRRIARRRNVTLLCGCADESRCHRTLLRRMLSPSDAEARTPRLGKNATGRGGSGGRAAASAST